MTLKQRLKQIEELQAVDTPWEVMRIFGKVQLYGDQISFYSNGDNDFVNLQEARDAAKWITEQLGGYIVWDENVKKGVKK